MANDRFLLIKAGSMDLWENIHHVAVMCLAAELTNRYPVVFWGTNCLYNGALINNAFDLYFSPVSPFVIYNLMQPAFTFYPPIWKYDNLMSADPDLEKTAYRDVGHLMDSNANVVVSDTKLSVRQLIPWIKKSHPLYGMTPIMMYRLLLKKYIRLKPDATGEIQAYSDNMLKNAGPALAVHMPSDISMGMYSQISAFARLNLSYHAKLHIARSDVFEVDDTIDQHQSVRLIDAKQAQDPYGIFHPEIKRTLGKYALEKVFLITDREDILGEYTDRYGSRLLYSNIARTPALESGKNEQIETFLNMRSKGLEILKDTYTASRCDFFLGYGNSALSQAVTRLKEWSDTNVKLAYWMFPKNYTFSYNFVKTGRDAPQEADGKYRLLVKKTGNTFKNVLRVFK